MATAFKYNVGKGIILKDKSIGTVISNGKHSYKVVIARPDEKKTIDVWGFDIINNKADILIERN